MGFKKVTLKAMRKALLKEALLLSNKQITVVFAAVILLIAAGVIFFLSPNVAQATHCTNQCIVAALCTSIAPDCAPDPNTPAPCAFIGTFCIDAVNVQCARNEILQGGQCVKVCDDDCAPICSGGASCGAGGQAQCLDGTNGAPEGPWVKDNPDTDCTIPDKKIWLERRVCGEFETANDNGGICYEWGEEKCPDRYGCIDPPWAAECKPFNDAACELTDAPDRIVVGRLFTGRFRIENTGIVTWCPWKGEENGFPAYAFGSQDPPYNTIWGVLSTIGRLFPAETLVRVAPNEDVWFTWRFKAPSSPGSYPFSFQMVLEKARPLPENVIEWFGKKCFKTIRDRPIPILDNTCPEYDRQLGGDSCWGGSQKESGKLGTSVCAASCEACNDLCQDIYGQNATYIFDSTTGRCGCEASTDWDPEPSLGQNKACSSASGDPPYTSCVIGGKSGIPCYNIADCTRPSHSVCNYALQRCEFPGNNGPGINQCGLANDPQNDLCILQDVPPKIGETCGGTYVLNNACGFNFGDPLCDFSVDRMRKLVMQLDPVNYKAWTETIIPSESSYNPNAYNPNSTSGTAWGLLQMGHDAWSSPPCAVTLSRQMNTIYDRGDVIWNLQIYNAIQYNMARGNDFKYWPYPQFWK